MTKKLEKMLVVEDDPKHLAEARELFEGIDGLQTFYATSLVEVIGEEESRGMLYEFKEVGGEITPTPLVDGVITDLFFPYEPKLDNKPNGIIVAVICQKLRIPYVVCTAGHHHGKDGWAISAIYHTERPEIRMPRIIEGGPFCRYKEAEHKRWADAYKALKKIVESDKYL